MNFLDKLNLRPGEKRLVVLIAVVLFVVLNAFLVWPRFKDWDKSKKELVDARKTLADYRTEIAKAPEYKKTKQRLEGQGSSLIPQEAAVQLRRTIENQISLSGVIPNGINDLAAKDAPDQFFAERTVTMGFVSTPDNALVDFLFNIGDRSMIRVKDLTIWPDTSMQKLQGSISLTVSYQKRSTLATNAPKTSASTNAPAKSPTNSTEKAGTKPNSKPASPTTKPSPQPASTEKKDPAKR